MSSPYQILGISEDSTIEQVKEQYRQLARVQHPDKGGNAEMFKITKIAFKMIIESLKKGVPIQKQTSTTFVEMRDASQKFLPIQKQAEPHEFLGTDPNIDANRHFDRENFNQKFIQNRQQKEDYLLTPSDTDYRENRTKDQLLTEQASIDSELGQIKPMFSGKDFNNNAFQRMFQQINGTPETANKSMQPYEEPQALVSGMQPFTEIDDEHKVKQTDKLSSLGFSGYEDGFRGGKHPDQIDRTLLNSFASQPDITNANAIEEGYHSNMTKKLSDYNSLQLNFHPKPANPGQLPSELMSQKSANDHISKNQSNDLFSQKMQERNNLTNGLRYGPGNEPPKKKELNGSSNGNGNGNSSNNTINDRNIPLHHQSLPIMDYPRSSNGQPGQPSPPQNQMMPMRSEYQRQPPIENQQNDDYFVKISGQQPQQQQQQQFQQQPQQFQQQQFQQQQQQQQPQMYNGNYYQLPSFQQNTQQPDFNQIQKQLQDLQKTVQQQNKVIRTLTTKKKNKL